jgi:hypothetical protein
MGREIRKLHYLSEISTAAELRAARGELEVREWFASRRLVDDAIDTFTIENLISVVAPPGSLVDRVIGGIGTGIAAAQGILGFAGSLFGGRGREHTGAPRRAVRAKSPAHAGARRTHSVRRKR